MVSHQLDGFMHDASTTTLALRANAGFEFMSSDRGDLGPEANLVPGTGVCGNLAFMKANPDVTRRFTQALRDASASYQSAEGGHGGDHGRVVAPGSGGDRGHVSSV